MRTSGSQPLDLLSPAGRRVGGEPALMRLIDQQFLKTPFYGSRRMTACLGAIRGDGQSQAGPATHGEDGLGGAVSQAADDHGGAGREGLSLLAARPEVDPRRRGLEFGHHLRADEARVHVPDGGDRLVQPVRVVVAAVEHTGGRVLSGGAGRGVVARQAGDFQHRPRVTVHVAGVHRPVGGGWGRGEPGRAGACVGQRVRGASLEEREIRGHLH